MKGVKVKSVCGGRGGGMSFVYYFEEFKKKIIGYFVRKLGQQNF